MIRVVLHTIALLLISLSALLYLSAATGLWHEHASVVDLFGCADEIAVNTKGDHE